MDPAGEVNSTRRHLHRGRYGRSHRAEGETNLCYRKPGIQRSQQELLILRPSGKKTSNVLESMKMITVGGLESRTHRDEQCVFCKDRSDLTGSVYDAS